MNTNSSYFSPSRSPYESHSSSNTPSEEFFDDYFQTETQENPENNQTVDYTPFSFQEYSLGPIVEEVISEEAFSSYLSQGFYRKAATFLNTLSKQSNESFPLYLAQFKGVLKTKCSDLINLFKIKKLDELEALIKELSIESWETIDCCLLPYAEGFQALLVQAKKLANYGNWLEKYPDSPFFFYKATRLEFQKKDFESYLLKSRKFLESYDPTREDPIQINAVCLRHIYNCKFHALTQIKADNEIIKSEFDKLIELWGQREDLYLNYLKFLANNPAQEAQFSLILKAAFEKTENFSRFFYFLAKSLYKKKNYEAINKIFSLINELSLQIEPLYLYKFYYLLFKANQLSLDNCEAFFKSSFEALKDEEVKTIFRAGFYRFQNNFEALLQCVESLEKTLCNNCLRCSIKAEIFLLKGYLEDGFSALEPIAREFPKAPFDKDIFTLLCFSTQRYQYAELNCDYNIKNSFLDVLFRRFSSLSRENCEPSIKTFVNLNSRLSIEDFDFYLLSYLLFLESCSLRFGVKREEALTISEKLIERDKTNSFYHMLRLRTLPDSSIGKAIDELLINGSDLNYFIPKELSRLYDKNKAAYNPYLKSAFIKLYLAATSFYEKESSLENCLLTYKAFFLEISGNFSQVFSVPVTRKEGEEKDQFQIKRYLFLLLELSKTFLTTKFFIESAELMPKEDLYLKLLSGNTQEHEREYVKNFIAGITSSRISQILSYKENLRNAILDTCGLMGVLFNQSKYQEALKLSEQCPLSTEIPEETALLLMKKAIAEKALRKLPQALESIKKAIRFFPSLPGLLLGAEIALLNKEYSLALSYYENCFPNDGEIVDVKHYLGRAKCKIGANQVDPTVLIDLSAFINQTNASQVPESQQLEAHELFFTTYIKLQGEMPQALELIPKFLPKSSTIFYRRALYYQSKNKPDKAIEDVLAYEKLMDEKGDFAASEIPLVTLHLTEIYLFANLCLNRSLADYVSKIRSYADQNPKFFNLCYQLQYHSNKEDPEGIKLTLDLIAKHYPEKIKNPRFLEAVAIHRAKAILFEGNPFFAAMTLEPQIRSKFPSPVVAILLAITKRAKEAEALVVSFPEGSSKKIISLWGSLDRAESLLDKQNLSSLYEKEVFKTSELLYALSYLYFLKEIDVIENVFPFIQKFCKCCASLHSSLVILAANIISAQNNQLSLFVLDLGLDRSEKKFKIFEKYIETLKSVLEKEGDSAELNCHFVKLFSFLAGFPQENIDSVQIQILLQKLFNKKDASIFELYNERLKGLSLLPTQSKAAYPPQSLGPQLQPIELETSISKILPFAPTIKKSETQIPPIFQKITDTTQQIPQTAALYLPRQENPRYARTTVQTILPKPSGIRELPQNAMPGKQPTPRKTFEQHDQTLQARLQNKVMPNKKAIVRTPHTKPMPVLSANRPLTHLPMPSSQPMGPIPFLPVFFPIHGMQPLLFQTKTIPLAGQSQQTIRTPLPQQGLTQSISQTYPLLQRAAPLPTPVNNPQLQETLPSSQISSLQQKSLFQSTREQIQKLAQPVPQSFFQMPSGAQAAYPAQASRTQALTPLLPNQSQSLPQSISKAYLDRRSINADSKSQTFQSINNEFGREPALEMSTLSHERESQSKAYSKALPKSKQIKTSSYKATRELVETLENEAAASSILAEQERVALLDKSEETISLLEPTRKRKPESEVEPQEALGEYLDHLENPDFLDDLLKNIEKGIAESSIDEASPPLTYDLNQESSYVYDLISQIDNNGLFLGDVVDYRLIEYLESQMQRNFPVVLISKTENSDFIFKGNSEKSLLFEYLLNDKRKIIYYAPKSSLNEVISEFKKILLDKKINLLKERLKNIKKNLKKNYLRNNLKLMQTLSFLIMKVTESEPYDNDFKVSLLALDTKLQELGRKGGINLSSTVNTLESCPHIRSKLNSSLFTFLSSPVSSLISQDLKVGKLIFLASEDRGIRAERELSLSNLEVSTIFYPPSEFHERFEVHSMPLIIVDMDQKRLSAALYNLWNFLPSKDPALRLRSRLSFQTLSKKIETLLQNPIATDQKLLSKDFEALKAYFFMLIKFASKLRCSHCSINLSKSFFDTYIKYDNYKIDKKRALILFTRFLEEHTSNENSIIFWRDKFETEYRGELDVPEEPSPPPIDLTASNPILSQDGLMEERLRQRKKREAELKEEKLSETQELEAFKEFMSESVLSGNLETISSNSTASPQKPLDTPSSPKEYQIKINREFKISGALRNKVMERAANWAKVYPIESIHYKKTWRKEETPFEMPMATYAEKNLHLLRTQQFYLNMQYKASVEIRDAKLELYKRCHGLLQTSHSELGDNDKSTLISLFHSRKRTMPFGRAQERDKKYAKLKKSPSKLSDLKMKEKVKSIHKHYLYYKDYADNLGQALSQGMDLVVKKYAEILDEKLATLSYNVLPDFEASLGAFKLLNEFNDCLSSHQNRLKLNSINDSKTIVYLDTVYNLKKDFFRIKEAFLSKCLLELNKKNLELIEGETNNKDAASPTSLKNNFYLTCQKLFDEFYSLEQWALDNLSEPEEKIRDIRKKIREISKLIANFYSNFSSLLASEMSSKKLSLSRNFKIYLMKEIKIAIIKKMEYLKTCKEKNLLEPCDIVSSVQIDMAKSLIISLLKELQYFHNGLKNEAQGDEPLAKTLNELGEFMQTNFEVIIQED